MNVTISQRLLGAIISISIGLGPLVQGQTPAGARQSSEDAELRQAQQELQAKLGVAVAPAERLQAVREFQRQQESRMEALRLNVRDQPRPPIPYIRQIEIPAEATPAVEELLVQQAYVRNQQIWLANALRQTTPAQQQSAINTWRQASRPAFAALEARSAAVQAESRAKPLPLPPLPQIPTGTSEEMRQALLRRHAEVTRLVQAENARRAQAASADPSAPADSPARTSSTSKTINLEP
jgi:hypothetical protein